MIHLGLSWRDPGDVLHVLEIWACGCTGVLTMLGDCL